MRMAAWPREIDARGLSCCSGRPLRKVAEMIVLNMFNCFVWMSCSGLIVSDCTASLTECRFESNVAFGTGGALHAEEGARVTIDRCHFYGNKIDVGAVGQPGSGAAISSSESMWVTSSPSSSRSIDVIKGVYAHGV